MLHLIIMLSHSVEICHHFCTALRPQMIQCHGPLSRYVKLRVVHAPGTFSPQPTSKDTTNQRSRHASRHVREARAVMHVGIANPRWQVKRSRYSRLVRKPQFHLSGKRLVRCLITTSSVCISRANTNLITRLLGNSQFNPRVCGYDFNIYWNTCCGLSSSSFLDECHITHLVINQTWFR